MNNTVGHSLQQNQNYKGFGRGKSTNYNQNNNPFGNTMGYTGKKFTGQSRITSLNRAINSPGLYKNKA